MAETNAEDTMEKTAPKRRLFRLRSAPVSLQIALGFVIAGGGALTAYSIVPPEDLAIIRQVETPKLGQGAEIEHLAQATVNQRVQAANNAIQRRTVFTELFDHGDELFELDFNALDGGGAYVNPQQRFTRFPRADQKGPDDWFNHEPGRATGPNGTNCFSCHSLEVADGAGGANSNVHRDPLRTGRSELFIQRNTPHLHGTGGLQRLAEEMTVQLQQRRDMGAADCNCGSTSRSNPPCAARRVALNGIKAFQGFQGIDFGTAIISRLPGATSCRVQVLPPTGFTTKAVSDDLVVRPFQWKGSVSNLRDFVRGAMHNELGMQAVEFFQNDQLDGDHDSISGELTVGDVTALALYMAGQPRPTTKIELDNLRQVNAEVAALVEPLPAAERQSILRGETAFNQAQCNTCHTPEMRLTDPTFSEPSTVPDHRDRVFPGGRLPSELGFLPNVRVQVDLTRDLPDNQFPVGVGQNQTQLGSFRRIGQQAIIEPFSDLRRHDMGPGMAEPVDEVGTGNAVFLTRTLWGAGSTAPYLHDGRAVTITEAILWHKGEAERSRQAFVALSLQQKRDLVAFVNNLVLFLPEEEEGEEEPGGGGGGGVADPD
jgi:hypothetical protein